MDGHLEGIFRGLQFPGELRIGHVPTLPQQKDLEPLKVSRFAAVHEFLAQSRQYSIQESQRPTATEDSLRRFVVGRIAP